MLEGGAIPSCPPTTAKVGGSIWPYAASAHNLGDVLHHPAFAGFASLLLP
jgi:hypothetical protein